MSGTRKGFLGGAGPRAVQYRSLESINYVLYSTVVYKLCNFKIPIENYFD